MNHTSWKRLSSYELGLPYDPNTVAYVNVLCDQLIVPLTSSLLDILMNECELFTIAIKNRTNVVISSTSTKCVQNMLLYYQSHHRGVVDGQPDA